MMSPAIDAALVTVVVVEDDPDMRFLVMATLTLDGRCQVIGEAWTGHDAFHVWNDNLPDVVVLDLRLPGQSGLEITRSILAADARQRIILFSAYLDPADEREALRLGVTSCVSKNAVDFLPDAIVAAAQTRRLVPVQEPTCGH